MKLGLITHDSKKYKITCEMIFSWILNKKIGDLKSKQFLNIPNVVIDCFLKCIKTKLLFHA